MQLKLWRLLVIVCLMMSFLWGYAIGAHSWYFFRTWTFGVWGTYMIGVLPLVFLGAYELKSRGLLLAYDEEEGSKVWLGRSVVVGGAFLGLVLSLVGQPYAVVWWMFVMLMSLFLLKTAWWRFVPLGVCPFLIGNALATSGGWSAGILLPLLFMIFTSLLLIWSRTYRALGLLIVVNVGYVIFEIMRELMGLL